MRDITLAIITRLKTSSLIYAIAGSRIHRATIPYDDPTLPAIVVSKVSDIRPGDTDFAYSTARIQVTVFAASDGEADNLSCLVVDDLHQVVNTIFSGLTIVSIWDAGQYSDVNPDSAIWMYHRDFMVNYL